MDKIPYALKLDPAVHEAAAAQAKREYTSLNGLINRLLGDALNVASPSVVRNIHRDAFNVE